MAKNKSPQKDVNKKATTNLTKSEKNFMDVNNNKADQGNPDCWIFYPTRCLSIPKRLK